MSNVLYLATKHTNNVLTFGYLFMFNNYVSPLHTHVVDDELFYVASGEWKFEIADTRENNFLLIL